MLLDIAEINRREEMIFVLIALRFSISPIGHWRNTWHKAIEWMNNNSVSYGKGILNTRKERQYWAFQRYKSWLNSFHEQWLQEMEYEDLDWLIFKILLVMQLWFHGGRVPYDAVGRWISGTQGIYPKECLLVILFGKLSVIMAFVREQSEYKLCSYSPDRIKRINTGKTLISMCLLLII